MDYLCLTLMIAGVSLFLVVLGIGWMDEMDNPYTGIVYDTKLGTTISWDRLAREHYTSELERHNALQRSRHALDVSIETITNGVITLKVKNDTEIHLREWDALVHSVTSWEGGTHG